MAGTDASQKLEEAKLLLTDRAVPLSEARKRFGKLFGDDYFAVWDRADRLLTFLESLEGEDLKHALDVYLGYCNEELVELYSNLVYRDVKVRHAIVKRLGSSLTDPSTTLNFVTSPTLEPEDLETLLGDVQKVYGEQRTRFVALSLLKMANSKLGDHNLALRIRDSVARAMGQDFMINAGTISSEISSVVEPIQAFELLAQMAAVAYGDGLKYLEQELMEAPPGQRALFRAAVELNGTVPSWKEMVERVCEQDDDWEGEELDRL